MNSINNILNNYSKLEKNGAKNKKKERPINMKWEQAKQFGEYVGIPTTVVLRMFKLYDIKTVLSLRSWLYDIPYDNRKGGKIALAYWKLKQPRES